MLARFRLNWLIEVCYLFLSWLALGGLQAISRMDYSADYTAETSAIDKKSGSHDGAWHSEYSDITIVTISQTLMD